VKDGPTVLLRLLRCNEWSFDIFEFGESCNNRPLQVLVQYLFRTYNLSSAFQVEPETLNSFLTELESAYLNVAYHNNYHAADVVQSIHFYFQSKHFGKLVALEDIFAGIVAASLHDVGHPGNNNHFEVAAFSPLAVAYNDRSVLENFHLATGFRILQKQECNIFANLPLADRRRIRETIILMVLATDMQQHIHLIAKLQAVLEQKRGMKTWFSPNDLEDRRTLLTIGIHTADISSASKKLPISLEWAHRIHEEFWIQGDKERSLNLPVAAVMDRSRPNLQKSQIGFITLVVDPLYKVFVEICPELKVCISQQNKNLDYWKSRVDLLTDIKKHFKDASEEKKE
jgi:cAMP-specific phosphodiesterase 4